MRIAGHEHVLCGVALSYELVEKRLSLFHNLAQCGAGEQFQVNQYLIVSGASAVYLLAHIAKGTRQQQLYLRVNVLDVVLNDKLPTLTQGVNLAQLLQQLRQLVIADEAYAVEHRDVGHAAQHVIFCQIEVHLAVTTYGEALYLLVDFKSF